MRRTLVSVALATLTLTACDQHTAGTPASAYVQCQAEDGSTPGQVFPCYWDAAHQGNGRGASYLLAEPACSGPSGYALPDGRVSAPC